MLKWISTGMAAAFSGCTSGISGMLLPRQRTPLTSRSCQAQSDPSSGEKKNGPRSVASIVCVPADGWKRRWVVLVAL